MSKQNNLTDFLTDVADAIRQKKGTQAPINPQDFSSEIASIPTGGNNPLQDMLDRSSNTYGGYLFSAINNSTNYNIFSRLTYENLITLDFSNKHYTNANSMFENCTSLTTIPLLDFSSVTSAVSMFNGCTSLTTVPQLDFSKVTNAESLFFNCKKLVTIPQLDFSSVGNANGIFSNCSSLTTVPQLDFSKVTNASGMFSGCTSLSTVLQLNFSEVTSAVSMFNGCWSLTTVPQLDFSKVTNASYMFNGCTSLTTVPQLDFSSVTDATNMFSGCTSLTTVPQLDFSKVTKASGIFSNCSSLTTLDFSNIKTIGPKFAQYSSSLSTLIIRNPTTLATLGSTNAFSNTPIASGTGYIYVPDDLVNSYKQATNWSTYAAQIKGLSELPQGE